MAVFVRMLYAIIMTRFLSTMLALHFLARHGCLSENTLYPRHDSISGQNVGLTFSSKTWLCMRKRFIPSSSLHFCPPCWPYIFLQDMAQVSVKILYMLIMTAFLATMQALHSLQDMAVSVKTLHTLIMTTFLANMLSLYFFTKTWLCV